MSRVAIVVAVLLLASPAAADEMADGIKRARVKLDAGDADGCIRELTALAEAQVDDPRPLTLLAYALFTENELQAAAEHLADYLEARAGDRYAIDLLSQIAFRALDGGDPELGRSCFQILKRADPQQKEHRYHWAIASHRMGQLDSVRAACRELIVDYPSFDSPYRLLAKVLLDEGRYEEAVRVYRDLSRERSGDPSVWLSLGGVLLWNLRDYARAREAYRNALEIADQGSQEHGEARAGLTRVDVEVARSERLGGRMRFLTDLLYAVLAGYGVLFVALAYLTRPRESERPA